MAHVSVEEIADEFDLFGEEADDDQLQKFQELCRSYSVEANSIVNQWMAFSSSKKVDLSMESLEVFDREWLPKKLQKSHMKTPQQKRSKMYTKDTIDSVLEDQMDVLGAYATPEEKSQIVQATKRQLTPETVSANKRQMGINRSPAVNTTFTATAISPAGSTPSAKFSSRSNAGDVVHKFGNATGNSWKGEGQGCRVCDYDPITTLTPHIKYMFQKMSEKAYVLNDVIQEMSTRLQNAHGIEDFGHVSLPSQESTIVAGRICCDSVGKLNSQSVLLEGSRETSAGKCISLDLSELKQYSLFPGQIIACEGNNPHGNKFIVTKVFDSVALPFPEVNHEQENVGKLHLFVAVGPYSPSDCLDYSPLTDLIKYINRDKPDLCILMGPFVDMKNSFINSGEVDETYEDIFINQMLELGRLTQKVGCTVVVVSSRRDAHQCFSVYPQPPYVFPSHRSDGSKITNAEMDLIKHLRFVSDPATLSVNGVVIGLTSTDILMHLTKSEISQGSSHGGLDRMGCLAQHILHQHSYYPLCPPAEEMSVDYELWEAHARLPVTPHILILPSDLKAFVKDVAGCCCINPGRLTKGVVGGTYVQMVVDTPALTTSTSPASACMAQIIKV